MQVHYAKLWRRVLSTYFYAIFVYSYKDQADFIGTKIY